MATRSHPHEARAHRGGAGPSYTQKLGMGSPLPRSDVLKRHHRLVPYPAWAEPEGGTRSPRKRSKSPVTLELNPSSDLLSVSMVKA